MPDESFEFISEPITPEPGAFDTTLMTQGLASLPRAFTWRDRRYEIVECLDHSKQSSPERGVATNERYLRRQSFAVRLDTDQIAEIYVLRQSPAGQRNAKKRWYLYRITRLNDDNNCSDDSNRVG